MRALSEKNFSFCVTPIETANRPLASGFFWEKDSHCFLITNWHVVTGSDLNKPNETKKDAPRSIMFRLIRRPKQEDIQKSEVLQRGVSEAKKHEKCVFSSKHEIDLYKDGAPIWHESSNDCELGKIDVVAIPLEKDLFSNQSIVTTSMNKHEDISKQLVPKPSDDCFILGYPKGMSGQAHTPIWKRGSIATEPNLNYKNSPIVLVDTATRKGMSGSPVIFRQNSCFVKKKINGQFVLDPDNSFIGESNNILGVYSGRIGDEKDVQLGYVWKKEVIDDILENI